jgi:hypothetical protein
MPYKGLYFALWTNCRRIHTAFFCPKGWISSSPTFQPFRFTKSSYPKLLFISELPGSVQRVQRKPRYLNPWPGREAQGQVAASGSGRIRSGPSQCSTNRPSGRQRAAKTFHSAVSPSPRPVTSCSLALCARVLAPYLSKGFWSRSLADRRGERAAL